MSLILITESGPNKVACWQGLLTGPVMHSRGSQTSVSESLGIYQIWSQVWPGNLHI